MSRSTPEVLRSAARVLESGEPQAALELLGAAPREDPYVLNACAVCYMRMGKIREAIAIYRRLTLRENQLSIDLTQPTAFLVNFATALLLDRNANGCTTLLREIARDDDERVIRLRAAIQRWKRQLGWWRRLSFALYGDVKRAIELDFPPGEIAMPEFVTAEAATAAGPRSEARPRP